MYEVFFIRNIGFLIYKEIPQHYTFNKLELNCNELSNGLDAIPALSAA